MQSAQGDMDINATLTTVEPATPSPTNDRTNFYLTVASLCLGIVNTVIVISMLLWLFRHPKLRGGSKSSKSKAKPPSPKKILTIDYRMSDLDAVGETTFAIGQPLPQEGGRASAHGDGQGRARDNPSFSAAPERLTAAAVYENTRIPSQII